MKSKNKKYWENLERIALKEGDLKFALECQEEKSKAGQFVSNKIS